MPPGREALLRDGDHHGEREGRERVPTERVDVVGGEGDDERDCGVDRPSQRESPGSEDDHHDGADGERGVEDVAELTTGDVDHRGQEAGHGLVPPGAEDPLRVERHPPRVEPPLQPCQVADRPHAGCHHRGETDDHSPSESQVVEHGDEQRDRDERARRSSEPRRQAEGDGRRPPLATDREHRPERQSQGQRLGVREHQHRGGGEQRQPPHARHGESAVSRDVLHEQVHEDQRGQRGQVRDHEEPEVVVTAEEPSDPATEQREEREEPLHLGRDAVVAVLGEVAVVGAVPQEQTLVPDRGCGLESVEPRHRRRGPRDGEEDSRRDPRRERVQVRAGSDAVERTFHGGHGVSRRGSWPPACRGSPRARPPAPRT